MITNPLRLVELCLNSSITVLESLTKEGTPFEWKENVFLPQQLCEELLEKLRTHTSCCDNFLDVFSNPETCRLLRVNLSGAYITDVGLRKISVHAIKELNISNCKHVEQLQCLIQPLCQKSLVVLNASGCVKITDFLQISNFSNLQDLDLSDTSLDQETFKLMFESGFDHLVNLNLSRCAGITNLDPLENTVPQLISLDLSETKICSIKPLLTVSGTLQWLCLHGCTDISNADMFAENLSKLVNLQYLDISKFYDVAFRRGDTPLHQPVIDSKRLQRFVSNLPKLTSLDLSGTLVCNDSSGLDCLRERPVQLEMLGLLFTEACLYPDLPAKVVTGDADIEQIMTSINIYLDKHMFTRKLLKELTTYITNYQRVDRKHAAKLVAEIMFKYPMDFYIQHQSSVAAYYILKEEEDTSDISGPLARVIVNALENHSTEPQLVKNMCLTLCNLEIPNDLLFDYERIMKLLFDVALTHPEDQVQRIAICLCNAMVCQVNNSQKEAVGNIGGIEIVLAVIEKKLADQQRGSVLNTCWSCLWNVTDETPANCAKFIQGGGISLLLKCHQEFPQDEELTRNMLGLLGNVAEVQSLRHHMMNQEIIQMLFDLLEPLPRGELEIGYNVSGIFCHLAYDGEAAWTVTYPRRYKCLLKMIEAVGSWNIKTQRHMSYRSFAPILRLLPCFDMPQLQHWATWALANLCYIDKHKYCQMLIDEKGVPLLEAIRDYAWSAANIKEYSRVALNLCQEVINEKNKETHEEEETCDHSADNQYESTWGPFAKK